MGFDLDRIRRPSRLSMIGGGAQGGSAKPRQERERMDRQNEQRQEEDGPSGIGSSAREGTSAGSANDNRAGPKRSPDSRKG
ncbi:hypothetical protein GCM10028796_20440 [Ramlibacter monticola]|uniref:Uncharacterized protein n=1 Tax=Ramlibacter monticola TaxID=1926872 RepID=A0A936YZG4_9BURK|nr:hypothetical protein [Ramlibacter monticola]MBL0392300.1 hypothetical protein [Ramlibacter monticola]